VIGAAPQQRTEARLAQRNGHRPGVLATTAGIWSYEFPSCGPARASPACWSAAAGSTRRCSRW
jgi:hypothetical protein